MINLTSRFFSEHGRFFLSLVRWMTTSLPAPNLSKTPHKRSQKYPTTAKVPHQRFQCSSSKFTALPDQSSQKYRTKVPKNTSPNSQRSLTNVSKKSLASIFPKYCSQSCLTKPPKSILSKFSQKCKLLRLITLMFWLIFFLTNFVINYVIFSFAVLEKQSERRLDFMKKKIISK